MSCGADRICGEEKKPARSGSLIFGGQEDRPGGVLQGSGACVKLRTAWVWGDGAEP